MNFFITYHVYWDPHMILKWSQSPYTRCFLCWKIILNPNWSIHHCPLAHELINYHKITFWGMIMCILQCATKNMLFPQDHYCGVHFFSIEYNHTLPTLINGNVFDYYTYPSEYLPLDWNSDRTTHLNHCELYCLMQFMESTLIKEIYRHVLAGSSNEIIYGEIAVEWEETSIGWSDKGPSDKEWTVGWWNVDSGRLGESCCVLPLWSQDTGLGNRLYLRCTFACILTNFR